MHFRPARGPRRAPILFSYDGSEETVGLIIEPGGEEQGVRVARRKSIPECQAPQAVDRDRIGISGLELTEEPPGKSIEGVDATVAEITDQQGIAERAEIGGSQSQAPGRVKRPLRSEASDQPAIGVEDIHEPIARACYIIVMFRVLQGKGDIEWVINALDAEGSKALGWWSWYRTVSRQIRVGEGCDQTKLGIELLDHAEAEIGGEQEAAAAACREGQAFVDRTREPPLTYGGAINHEDGMGRVHVGAKSRNCPIFSCKEELAWGELRVLTDDKVDRAVENIASGRRGSYTVGSRDSDRWWDLLASARVLRGKACAIV